MKNVSVLILVILIVVVLGIFFVTFQVRETEIAIVTTFGKPSNDSIDEPGFYFRWPAPIQSVYKFDSRNHLFEGIMEETTTRGGEPIIITSYVVWDIGDPLRFLESVHDKKGAEEHLRALLRNTQNEVVGRFYFSEFVNADKEKIKFEQVEQKMLEGLKGQALADYGIDIKEVGIKQLGISDKVTEDVFARMRADRKRKTEETIAQGNAEATKIRTDAESKKTELLAIVEAEAKSIKGSGDAEAAKYYKLLEADEDLAMFLRDLESLKMILKEKSTIVIGAESEPFKLLKSVPDIK
ncbi:MAG: protease modulator HflC [Sedimentisphaerales bacterium]|nr:protease modulator HflC [Sedimentisphaerales bacterium]